MEQNRNEKIVDTNLGEIEAEFADMVWEAAPVKTSEVIKMCAEKLGWKRTTTYTVLKKFCNKNIFAVENSIVSALVTRDEFYALKSERFVEDIFNGSLPAFISAFTSVKEMSEKEIEEIKRLISDY